MGPLNAARSSIALVVCSALASQSALSQETSPAEQAESSETIVITGSRIKRTEFSLPVPAQTLDAAELAVIGANELSEAIAEIPAVTPSVTTETSQSSTQDSGSSTISLRNLGSQRTLTLIDGRRTVGNTSTGSTISLSTIPDAFVDRIEVITGGASALYGSDAVTGVVNIITKNQFEGFSFETRYGVAQEGGNEEVGFELAAGANLNDDRGNLMFSIEYDREGAIRERQRDKAMVALGLEESRNADPDILEPARSSNIPGGLYAGNSGTAQEPDRDSSYWFYSENGTGELRPDFDRDVDGYNYLGHETISIPRERMLLAGKFTYNLTEDMEYFASAHYSWVHTKSERAPDTASSSRLRAHYPIYLSDGITPHPYVPETLFNDALETGRTDVQFRRRWTEFGNRFREADNDTFRLWTGIAGYLDDNWSYEVNVGYGKWRRSQSRVGDLIIPNYQQAIDVEYVDSSDLSLGLQCANDFARSSGCVPLNVFRAGSVSQDQVDWLILRDQLRAENSTTTASAWITGDVAELWAGPVSLAAGIDYRKEESQTRWDPISTSGGGTVTQQVNQNGEQDVKEGFVELILPLLSDLPFAKSVSIEGAVRSSDYSTIGNVMSWKFGGTWQINDSLSLRSVFARANRAPNNIELFSRGLGGQGGLDDPCDNVTATSTGTYDDTCRQDPTVASIIADEGIFLDEGGQVQQPTFGNGDLKEETADTLTAGIVITPSAIPHLNIAIDYYDIDIKDAIGDIESEDILELCYGSGNFDGTASCSIPVRDTSTGLLQEVRQTSLNVYARRTSGIDTTMSYRFDPKDAAIPLFNTIPGTVRLSGTFSYITELEEEQPIPGTDETFIEDDLGLLGAPDKKGRFSVRWNNGPMSVSWRGLYVGNVLNDSNDRARSIACQENDNCGDKIALSISPEWTHNLRLSYDLNAYLDKDIQIFGGINNITNNQGPNLYGTGNVGENHHSNYDITGRFFYGGIKINL